LPTPQKPSFTECSLSSPVGKIKRLTKKDIPSFVDFAPIKAVETKINFDNIIYFDAGDFCPTPAPSPPFPRTDKIGYPNNGDYILYNTKTQLPNYLEVMQGGIGNCVLDSLLALMAYNMPNELKRRIIRHPTSPHEFFVVVFDKLMSNPLLIRISALIPLDNEKDEWVYDRFPYDSITGKPIVWSYIMLKAYVCLATLFPGRFYEQDGVGYATLHIINTVNLQHALVGITSNDSGKTGMLRSFNEISAFLPNINNSSYYIQAGIDSGMDTLSPQHFWSDNGSALYIYDKNNKLQNVVLAYHAYSVLMYDSETQKVMLRNPWGQCTLKDKGRFGKTQAIIYQDGVMMLSGDDVSYYMMFYFAYHDK
jgi:hypothetical protein